jgi:putative oxidoreductase
MPQAGSQGHETIEDYVMMAPTEPLCVVLRTSRVGQPTLKLQSTEQRAVLALDLLSVGSRAALGVSFLLSVSDRLGFYGNPGARGVSWGTFEQFLGYAAKVNAFAPEWMIPFLGTAATVLELLFGVTLVLGLGLRWAAFGSASLLFLFGSAMAFSFGIKSPFDYSVFAAMCCALFLSLAGSTRWTVDSLL